MNRRNQTAHEADTNPTSMDNRWSIDEYMVEESIDSVERIPINPLNPARALYIIYKQVAEIRGYSEPSKSLLLTLSTNSFQKGQLSDHLDKP